MAKILIIDDDPDFTETTRVVLESAGYEVITAPDGEQGLRMVAEAKPDLVILDIIMETVLEGLHVSQQMANDPEKSRIPILMVTSIANTDYAALFPTDEYIHISGFVSKPISPATLLNRVASLLG